MKTLLFILMFVSSFGQNNNFNIKIGSDFNLIIYKDKLKKNDSIYGINSCNLIADIKNINIPIGTTHLVIDIKFIGVKNKKIEIPYLFNIKDDFYYKEVINRKRFNEQKKYYDIDNSINKKTLPINTKFEIVIKFMNINKEYKGVYEIIESNEMIEGNDIATELTSNITSYRKIVKNIIKREELIKYHITHSNKIIYDMIFYVH